jgi:1-acyl-sn-glycerol-3-phosphate acyltransferase
MSVSATARNVIAPALRWGYRLRVHGAHRCPRRGPLLVAAPHLGFLDATVIATCLPRPVDVLVDPGGLAAVGGKAPGRVLIDAADPGTGLREAVDTLEAGGAVGAWVGDGNERAAGYLLARTGSPVLPVVVLGGSGRHAGDLPGWRARVDVVVGDPVLLDAPADPASRAEVLLLAEAIRQSAVDHAERARQRMGYVDGVGVEDRDTATDNGAS